MVSKRMTKKRRGLNKRKSRKVKRGLRRSKKYILGGNTIEDLQKQEQKLQNDLIEINKNDYDKITALHNAEHLGDTHIVSETDLYKNKVKKIQKEIFVIQTKIKIKKFEEELKMHQDQLKGNNVNGDFLNYTSGEITKIENEIELLKKITTKSPPKSKSKETIPSPPHNSMVTIPMEMYSTLSKIFKIQK